MKLDPLFEIKDGKLLKIADKSEVNLSSVKKIELPWTVLEMESECYNEEHLAKLRNTLKEMEEINEFAIIVPVADRLISKEDGDFDEEAFISAYNHAARRIKDCSSVIGFEIPLEVSSQEDFVDTLSKKHAQYIYFTKGDNTITDRIISY